MCVVCLRLKFLMPLLTKFRAISSSFQETTKAKKKTWRNGGAGGGKPPKDWIVLSATPLFWEVKQFSYVGVSHTVPTGTFLYHYRFSHKVQPCTQSTSTSIKMHYAL